MASSAAEETAASSVAVEQAGRLQAEQALSLAQRKVQDEHEARRGAEEERGRCGAQLAATEEVRCQKYGGRV
eukprot:SAG11_NODE_285_length_11230_cov_6.339412_8_plen_72_part_00